MYSSVQAELGTRHIFFNASRVTTTCCFTNASRVSSVFFRPYFMHHHLFASCVVFFKNVKTIFYRVINIYKKCVSTPARMHPSTPSGGQLPPLLLADYLTPHGGQAHTSQEGMWGEWMREMEDGRRRGKRGEGHRVTRRSIAFASMTR